MIEVAAPQEPFTLGDIGKLLDQKLSPISEFLEQIKVDFGAFKESVRKELQEMGCKLQKFETETGKTTGRIEQLEKDSLALKSGGISKSVISGSARDNTIAIGKVPNASTIDQAKDWTREFCTKAGLPQPLEVFSKGDFKGLAFAKCMSETHREQLIASINSSSGETWANQDRPIDVRTAWGTLMGFKRILLGWGYNKACIKIDAVSGSLSVAGKEVLKVTVQDYVLNLAWSDGQWEEWGDLQKSSELTKLKDSGQEKLDRAKANASVTFKGAGKGPAASG